jgi:hypothetical protein
MEQDRPPTDGGGRGPDVLGDEDETRPTDELGSIEVPEAADATAAAESEGGSGHRGMPAAFGWFTGIGSHWWGRPLLVSVTALAAMAVLTLATIVQSPSEKGSGGAATTADTSTPRVSAPATTPPASPTPSASSTAPKAETGSPATSDRSAKDAVVDAVKDLGVTGELSVAVTDADSDSDSDDSTLARYDSSDDTGYDTASIVKVDILASLLLRDQRAGTGPTSYQRSLATEMIERSDNDAATDLYEAVGEASGLATQNARLGLHHTTGGSGELWGLTQTTVGDQIALLRAVFGDDSALSSSSRAYLSGLMKSVISGQRWGVSAADSDGTGFALKNGWLQRTATGLWDINSIGEVTYDGHRLLVSVLSSGQRSEQAGIDQVERAAHAAAKAYTAAGG